MLAMYILGKQKRGLLEVGGESGVALDAGVLGLAEAESEEQQEGGLQPARGLSPAPRDCLEAGRRG
jgi:hypothetical protein